MAIAQTAYRPIKMGQVVLKSGTFTLSGGSTGGTITVGGGGMKAYGASQDDGTVGAINPNYATHTLVLADFTANTTGRWWAICKP
jgi:hypothetical protein